MTRREKVLVALRRALIAAACLSVAYLSVLAVFSGWTPPIWFGRSGSGATTLVVVVVLAALCVLTYRAHTRARPGAIPGGVIAILAASSAALAFSAYLRCSDAKNFPLFTALIWTIGTVRGNSSDHYLGNGPCPKVEPAALEIARTSGQFVLYVSVIAILASLFVTEIDRVRVRLAHSITAIVDIDNDSRDMVVAVARSVQKERRTHLALIVAEDQVNAVRDLRVHGARVIAVDLDRLDRLELVPLWRKTRQLYLLGASPTTNLRRLAIIEQRMRATAKQRLPLIVRIDDPWQAAAWRAQRLGSRVVSGGGSGELAHEVGETSGSDALWAADAVGVHEVTAARLLDRIIEIGLITRIALVGTSPLTLALCASMARRQLEHNYYAPPEAPALPAITIVANNAEEYRKDIEFHQQQLGFPPADGWLAAANGPPSLAAITTLINAEKEARKRAHKDSETGDGKEECQGSAVDGAQPGAAQAESVAPGAAQEAPVVAGHNPAAGTDAQAVAMKEAQDDGHGGVAVKEAPADAVQESVKEAAADSQKDSQPAKNAEPGAAKDSVAEKPEDADTNDEGPPTVAIILTVPPGQGGTDAMLGTRLAARFPTLPIFALDPKTDQYQDTVPPIVGQLRTFRPAMDMPSSQGHDAWERAAMLIHERYAARAGHVSEATKPWAELNEFYRGSNRRLVRNALWMVEKIAGHSWDTFGGLPDEPTAAPADAATQEQTPEEKLQQMIQQKFDLLACIGFDHDTVLAMAKAEHEDWSRYYRRAGWHYDPKRDNDRKLHPNLVSWDTVKNDKEKLYTALNSLETTLYSLRALGFRSRPVWQRYRRTGTVTATRHARPWTWTNSSGQAMHARPGDWEVSDNAGQSWSVRDKIFRSSYQHIGGNVWRAKGIYRARPARDGETIDTLEGPAVATGFDWVVEGSHGERWVVPPDVFAHHYEPVQSG